MNRRHILPPPDCFVKIPRGKALQTSEKQRGFTLVELSIVLVIIGLIVGGVTAGSSMIRAAELRSVVTDYQRYKAAMYTFRDKYFALPGDMINATAFWGDNATYCADAAVANGSPGTCNGNGNGIFNYAGANGQEAEVFMFWQHLANAGLVEGTYDGISGTGGLHERTATNSPVSKINNATWFLYNWNTTYTGSGSVFDGTYRENMMQINVSGGGDVFSPEEVWNIDKKVDDGQPAYGIMHERMWGDCTTAANSADLGADYDFQETSKVCVPFFYMQ